MSSFKTAFRKGIPGMLADIADLLRQILDDQRAFHAYMVERDRRAEAPVQNVAEIRPATRLQAIPK